MASAREGLVGRGSGGKPGRYNKQTGVSREALFLLQSMPHGLLCRKTFCKMRSTGLTLQERGEGFKLKPESMISLP